MEHYTRILYLLYIAFLYKNLISFIVRVLSLVIVAIDYTCAVG